MQHVRVPVHDYVAAVFYRSVHHFIQFLEGPPGLPHIAARNAGIVCQGMVVGAYRGTEYHAAGVFVELPHRRLVVEAGPDIVPSEAYAPESHRLTVGSELGANHLQRCNFGLFRATANHYQSHNGSE